MRVLGSEPHLFGLRLSGHVLQAASLASGVGCFTSGPLPSPGCLLAPGSRASGIPCAGGGGGLILLYPLLASLVESPSLVPQSPGPRPPKVLRPSPLWPVRSQQSPSPLVSEEPRSCLGQAGPPTTRADKALMPDSRWVPGCVCMSCQGLLPDPRPRPQLPGPAAQEVSARPVLAVPGWPDSAVWLCSLCVLGNTTVSLIVVCFG